MPTITPEKLSQIKSIWDTSDDATKRAIEQEIRSYDPAFSGFDVSASMPVMSQSTPNFSLPDEIAAVAQGAVRGVSFGLLDVPEKARPREERLTKWSLPVIGEFSPARGLGEIAGSAVPYGMAGKLGRIVLRGGGEIIGAATGAAKGFGMLEGAKLASKVSSPFLEREVGAAILNSGSDLTKQGLEILKGERPNIDWTQVGDNAALGFALGLVTEAGIRGGKKVQELYRQRFKSLPKEIVEKAGNALEAKKAEIIKGLPEFSVSPPTPFSRWIGTPEIPGIPRLSPSTNIVGSIPEEAMQVAGLKRTGDVGRSLYPPEKGVSARLQPELLSDRIDQWMGSLRVKKGIEFNETLASEAKRIKVDPADLKITSYIFAQQRGKTATPQVLTKDDVISAAEFLDQRRRLGAPRNIGEEVGALRAIPQVEKKADVLALPAPSGTTVGPHSGVEFRKGAGQISRVPAQSEFGLGLPGEKVTLLPGPVTGPSSGRAVLPENAVALIKQAKKASPNDPFGFVAESLGLNPSQAQMRFRQDVYDVMGGNVDRSWLMRIGNEPIEDLTKHLVPQQGTKVQTPQGTLKFKRMKNPVSVKS